MHASRPASAEDSRQIANARKTVNFKRSGFQVLESMPIRSFVPCPCGAHARTSTTRPVATATALRLQDWPARRIVFVRRKGPDPDPSGVHSPPVHDDRNAAAPLTHDQKSRPQCNPQAVYVEDGF